MWKRVYLIFYQHRFITFKHAFEYFMDTIYTADIHVYIYKETEDQN